MKGKASLFVSFCLLFIILEGVESTPMCKECQKLANDLLYEVEANSTYEWIASELENICESVLSGNPILIKECKKIAVDLAKDLEGVGIFCLSFPFFNNQLKLN